MMREALSQFPHTDLVLVGQILFFVTFIAVTAWTFRRGGKKFYDPIASMPLKKGKEYE